MHCHFRTTILVTMHLQQKFPLLLTLKQIPLFLRGHRLNELRHIFQVFIRIFATLVLIGKPAIFPGSEVQ